MKREYVCIEKVRISSAEYLHIGDEVEFLCYTKDGNVQVSLENEEKVFIDLEIFKICFVPKNPNLIKVKD